MQDYGTLVPRAHSPNEYSLLIQIERVLEVSQMFSACPRRRPRVHPRGCLPIRILPPKTDHRFSWEEPLTHSLSEEKLYHVRKSCCETLLTDPIPSGSSCFACSVSNGNLVLLQSTNVRRYGNIGKLTNEKTKILRWVFSSELNARI